METSASKQHHWTKLLKFYGDQNKGRLTRVGVFEGGNDFWLEDGLPLAGLDVDVRGDVMTVEIVLGDQVKGTRHFAHAVRNARSLKLHLSPDQSGDGLDITDAEGKTLILRFEN